MSKLAPLQFKVSQEYRRADHVDALRDIARQVDGLTEGAISVVHNAQTTVPASASVAAAQGDWVRNSEPAVLGTPGSQYVIRGWTCVAGGSPGTWVEDRGLTGT